MKAVLFDLDGTLLDTLEDIADSVNTALAGEGLPPHPLDAYRRFVGDGIEHLIRRSLPPGDFDEEAVAAFLDAVRAEYGRRWACKTRPYDGIPELLADLEAHSVRTAVLSNKPHDMTVLCVQRFLGFHGFETVRGARSGTPRKPDPAAALEIARGMGVGPDRFLYVGDTPTDMRTGLNAGMTPVGVLWGFRGAEELREAGARHLVHAPADLLGLL